jgi:hypothetical protein
MIKIIKLTVIIIIVFLLIRNYSQSKVNTENFALGEGTSSHFVSVDNTLDFCILGDLSCILYLFGTKVIKNFIL